MLQSGEESQCHQDQKIERRAHPDDSLLQCPRNEFLHVEQNCGMDTGDTGQARRPFVYPRKQSRKDTNVIVKSSIGYRREDVLRWYGWGFKDSGFIVKKGLAMFIGNRYPICSESLPYMTTYINDRLQLNIADDVMIKEPRLPEDHEVERSRLTLQDVAAVRNLGVRISTKASDRVTRSSGQSMEEVQQLCLESNNPDIHPYYKMRLPDGVAWPRCHEEVVQLVQLATRRKIVIVPFGGGTSVAGGLSVPEKESRPVLTLDLATMNEILWIDAEGLTVCAEAGIAGIDLERELNARGLTTGHEPDSLEFSTLGGWVATRASGMKRGRYGNIEQLLLRARMVTARGELQMGARGPRSSSGPSWEHAALGSEGTLGVVTEVCLQLHPLPACMQHGSVLFPDFEIGGAFMRELSRRRWLPAGARLLDAEQFQFGLALRPPQSVFGNLQRAVQGAFLRYRGFQLDIACLCTLKYEGDHQEVLEHETRVLKLAAKYRGMSAGSEAGRRGYMMTYVVGYVRDIALQMHLVCESLETSVAWSKLPNLLASIKNCVRSECAKVGFPNPLIMCRLAQSYDEGCCLYTYYVFKSSPERIIHDVETVHAALRTVVIQQGGAISHHHGVGKHRLPWYEAAVSKVGRQMFLATKRALDPDNIFACGNIAVADEEPPTSKL